MSMHKQMIGKIGPGSVKEDITLEDYITRKEKAYAPKLTFNEWYLINFIANRVHGLLRKDNLRLDEACELAWNASRENL